MGIKMCPQCGGKVSDSRTDCPHCKYDFNSVKKCPDCEEQIEVSLTECPICGHVFEEETQEQKIDESQSEQKQNTVQDVQPKQDNGLVCPYCSSHEQMQITNDLYICTLCRKQFFDKRGLPTPKISVVSAKEDLSNTTTYKEDIACTEAEDTEAVSTELDGKKTANNKVGKTRLAGFTEQTASGKIKNKKTLIILLSLLSGIAIAVALSIIPSAIRAAKIKAGINNAFRIEDGVLVDFNELYLMYYGITEITIPDSVTSIGMGAFNDCSRLTSVTIPRSVTSIGEWAFYGCSRLTSIKVRKNSTVYKDIDGNLYTKDGKTLIQYAIGKTATSFTIPSGVTSISNYAFYYCSSLTSVTIPDSVTSIGDGAFFSCHSLTSIKYRGTETQWNAISLGSSWNSNTGSYSTITITYNYDGE